MIKEVLQDAREHMEKTISVLQSDLRAIRTGRASPTLLERIEVEYYGVATPLIQLAGVTVPEPRLLVIRPWDPKTISLIEKGDPQVGPGPHPEQRWPDHPAGAPAAH